MHSVIITWQNNNTRQTQYSLQQTTNSPHTFPYPNSETPTMATDELWNVDSIELPSTIVAANAPSPSNATILSTEHTALEATHVTRVAEFDEFQSRHEELNKEAIEIKASLAKDLITLEQLAAQTEALLAATHREEEVFAKFTKRIKTLVNKATPLHKEIEAIKTQLIEKDTKAKRAKEAEVKATLHSKILLECHQSNGKVFIMAMKKCNKFSEWKSTKENHNIGPQTEAILLVFYDILCFFSRAELKLFLGHKSPNHDVDGALTKVVEELLLVKATNKVGTEIYYL
jgi:hypothetical protein